MIEPKTHLIGNDWQAFENFRLNSGQGLKTGIGFIDKKIGGLPGLTCIMGEPKSCKSTLAMNIVLEKARVGHPIIYIDHENGIYRTRQRMLSYISGLPLHILKRTTQTQEENEKYTKAVDRLCRLPIYYLDNTETQDDLEDLFLFLECEHGKEVIIVVDSIQNMVSDFSERRNSVDYWVFWLNNLKKRYEQRVFIIIVSEKNRAAYGQEGRAGAKESGGIEYKSEIVFSLYPGKVQGTIVLSCPYYRDGETGILAVLEKSDPFTYRLNPIESVPE